MEAILVVDLDGVLADARWRARQYLRGGTWDWDGFYAACGGDQPVDAMVEFLARVVDGTPLHLAILTSRPASVEAETRAWLRAHVPFFMEDEDLLIMREEGGPYPPGEHAGTFKLAKVQELAESYDVIAVIDDDPLVCKTLREAGYLVLQVEGAGEMGGILERAGFVGPKGKRAWRPGRRNHE